MSNIFTVGMWVRVGQNGNQQGTPLSWREDTPFEVKVQSAKNYAQSKSTCAANP